MNYLHKIVSNYCIKFWYQYVPVGNVNVHVNSNTSKL